VVIQDRTGRFPLLGEQNKQQLRYQLQYVPLFLLQNFNKPVTSSGISDHDVLGQTKLWTLETWAVLIPGRHVQTYYSLAASRLTDILLQPKSSSSRMENSTQPTAWEIDIAHRSILMPAHKAASKINRCCSFDRALT
jgi:hypothetical protein